MIPKTDWKNKSSSFSKKIKKNKKKSYMKSIELFMKLDFAIVQY